MATSLEKVTQQLRQIKEEALQAQHNLSLMRKELESMVASQGGGTAAGIRAGTDRLLLGAGRTSNRANPYADPRLRIGAGDRLNIQRLGDDLQKQINTYTQAVIDYNIAEFRKLETVGTNVRPADIEARFQQVLRGMEQAVLAKIGQLEVIFQGSGIAGGLPAGQLTPLSLAGAFPQLVTGEPAYGGAPFNAPKLPTGDIIYNPQPTAPIYGAVGTVPPQPPEQDIIEAQFVDDIKLLEANVSSTSDSFKRLLESTEKSAAAINEEIAARESASQKLKQREEQLRQPASGARQKDEAEVRPTRESIIKEFSRQKLYGEAGQERFETVQTKAGQYGFSDQDIKSVQIYADQYARVNYETDKGDGIMRKLAITVDRAGNTLVSTQKQFRTFTGAIRRNISEMVKWSAAVLLVWGSIRKLQELLQLAISNETQLANVAVVLGRSQANLDTIFKEAAQAAYETGESINGVIEGYAAAYRATGNIENQAERSRVAQELLTDSLVLSKLSTLDQASALDTLVGALRQVGYGLDEGSKLIDKWVKVSRYAQVSVETLAESFAITATSASNAGVDIDYLNGLIATIAEVTTLSASESGNAIRAFISSFKSDSAVKELGQFGIAVQDLDGETRGFLDIMREISALFEAGIISESQLNQIGRAIGGRGARREAQVVAVIKNLSRAEELAAVGAEANGEAQAALDIQLQTVQTTLTRLDNAFLQLARTMGSDGGVLDHTDNLLNLSIKLIDALSAITEHVGRLTPVIAALGLAYAATTKQSRAFYATEAAAAVSGVLSKVSPRLEKKFADYALAPGLGRGAQFAGGAALQVGAGALTAYTAYTSAKEGDYASVGGAIGGAAVGALITGGNPIGIAIGTAAGKALASAVFNYEADFENFWQAVIGEGAKEGLEDAGTEVADPIQQAMEEAFKVAGRGAFTGEEGSAYVGKAGANVAAWLQNQATGIGRFFGGEGEFVTPEEVALQQAELLGERARIEKLIKDAKAQQQAQLGTEADTGFDFEFIRQQEAYLEKYSDYLDELESTAAKTARSRALAGDINERELRSTLDVIPKIQASITAFAVGFGDEFNKLNPQLKTAEQTMEAFSTIITQSSPEQLDYLNTLNSEIARVTNLVDIAKRTGEDFIIFKPDDKSTDASEEILKNLDEANDYIIEMSRNAAVFGASLYQAAQAARVELPTITTLNIDPRDLQKVLDRAREEQRKYIKSTYAADLNAGISIQEIESTFEPIMIQAGEGGGYTYAEGFMSSFLSSVVPAMQKAGELITPQPAALQIRQLDISSGQLPAVLERYQALVQNIRSQAAAGGFEVEINEETFAGLLNDYVAVPITADLSLLNLGMNELIDVNKKQLEGVYNLPTDASFYVPFQGYELGLGQDGGGGLGTAAGDLTGSAHRLDDAAIELKNAARLQGRLTHANAMDMRDFEIDKPQPQISREARALRLPKEPVPQFDPGLLDAWQRVPVQPEDTTFTEKFGQSVDSFNTGVESQLTFWENLLGLDLTPEPTMEEKRLEPLPLQQDNERIAGFWLKLFTILNQILNPAGEETGLIGVGTGAGTGPTVATQPTTPLGAGLPSTDVPTLGANITTAILDYFKTLINPQQNLQTLPDDLGKSLYSSWTRALQPLIDQGILQQTPTEPRLLPSIRSITEPEAFAQQPEGDYWQRFIQWLSPLLNNQGVGGGAGIGTSDLFSQATSDLASAAGSLESLAYPQLQGLGPAFPTDNFSDFGADFGGVLDLLSQKISNLSGFTANLKISSTTTTNLIVDGRTLAEIVKPYLYSDMIRFEESSSSVTRNLVV